MPVHIHSSVGGGDYFNVRGVNVLNLEPLLRDPHYRTVDVGAHPRWVSLRSRSDADGLDEERVPRLVGGGADALPDRVQGHAEALAGDVPRQDHLRHRRVSVRRGARCRGSVWLGVRTTRTALAAALAEMVAAREITEPRAMAFARAYLHDTAASLYRMIGALATASGSRRMCRLRPAARSRPAAASCALSSIR